HCLLIKVGVACRTCIQHHSDTREEQLSGGYNTYRDEKAGNPDCSPLFPILLQTGNLRSTHFATLSLKRVSK
ncbi:hypothetical protein, partial [Morganella morganii]|uniref:hypothetical protein n=1 Tax=Morganella morganii TaxID=582 RepID=UPI001C710319